MIKEKAMELVAALRSGKYLQGNGRLKKDEDHFCCLGVACEISGISQFKFNEDIGDGYYYDGYDYDGKCTFLPESVQNYFGFYKDNGEFRNDEILIINGKEYRSSLSSVNDDGVPFSEIADYIEKNWESL